MTPDRFVVLGGGGEAAAPVTAQPVLTAAARHAARAAARRYKGDTWLVADRATCPVTCQLRGKVTRVRDGKLANKCTQIVFFYETGAKKHQGDVLAWPCAQTNLRMSNFI